MRYALIFLVLLLATETARSQKSDKRPNIIVILADDMGYGDLGCYGHPTISTPELDKMATEGMRLTQCYAGAAVCTPSRAALLTGRFPVRTGVYGKGDVFRQNSATGLPHKEITIAEMLKEKGYATAIIGKWHLGSVKEYLPVRQGFDYWFGTPYSNDMGRVFTTRIDPDQPFPAGPRAGAPELPLFRNEEIIEYEPDQRYLTKRYTEEVIKFIRDHKNQPFFTYYASNFPHTPLYASPDFEGKSKRGIYGDVVSELDWSVGQIIQELKNLGIEDNTLVIFTSDNGPWLTQKDHGGSAGLLFEGKNSTYEGGMRVPGIAWWPGRIKANVTSTALFSALDIFPTIARITGSKIPGNLELDGMDQSELLLGTRTSIRTEIFYYINETLQAVRQGRWKAHFVTHASYSPEPPRVLDIPLLYDIEADPGEKYDLARHKPEIVKALTELYNRVKNAIPLPEPEIEKKLPGR